MASYKLLPYGISDFMQVRRENKYYVDKTMYLPTMEDAGNFLFLIRPRRFGKSLFLSMLTAYYDINKREQFDDLFEGLDIASHPTEGQGKYQVLHFDFSRVGSHIETLEEDFYSYCGQMLDDFATRYAPYYDDGYKEKVLAEKSFKTKLNYINNEAKRKGIPLYLIVDEYDNFTNTVLNEEGEGVYHALTHADGFYRETFKLFKGMFSRILMMGVSPVTMDDLTSGFNIAEAITMNPRFNMMLGFSETEVREMIRYYQSVGQIQADEEELITQMKPWYDNYCFAKKSVGRDPKMFNCDMVAYYLKSIIDTGDAPEQMIDRNTRTDYKKMQRLIQLDQLDGDRQGTLHQIAQDGFIYEDVEESFPAAELTDPQRFVSLLFYYGMLTIGDTYGARLKLIIPNNNVRLQYYEYLMREYQSIRRINIQPLQDSFDNAAIKGEWEEMVKLITDAYRDTTSVRSLIEGERNLQGFMNAYLSLCPYYLTAPEVELNHGYCDFFLMPDLKRFPMVRHSYILELKYLKSKATKEDAAKQWQDAIRQIKGYAKGEKVRLLVNDTQLHPIIIQIKGYELVRYEELDSNNS